MNGYVFRLTASGPQVLQVVPEVDWYRKRGNLIDFMKGPKPGKPGDVQSMLDELQGRSEEAEAIYTVRLREGMAVFVGDSPPEGSTKTGG
jgi:hypothetical protein